jgi:hypothetical protein
VGGIFNLRRLELLRWLWGFGKRQSMAEDLDYGSTGCPEKQNRLIAAAKAQHSIKVTVANVN